MPRAAGSTGSPARGTLPVVELALVAVRMHAVEGDDRGAAELPVGWTLEVGDLLVDEDGRAALNIDETGWYLSGESRTLWGAFQQAHHGAADRARPRQAAPARAD
jgi:hypothetical protein